MPPGKSADHTVVVGGGIMGLCTAWYLARRGRRVTICEQGRIAESASAGNAGIVALGHLPLPRPGLARKALRWMLDSRSPLYIRPRGDLHWLRWLWDFQRACNAAQVERSMSMLSAMGHATIDGWEEILAAESLDCTWERGGWLDVYRSEAGRREAEHEGEITERFGFAVQQQDGDTLRRDEPAFADEVGGAVRYPESAFLDPGLFLAGLAARLKARGVEIREESPVQRLILRRGRCLGVELAGDEKLEAAEVVLAAGVWTRALAWQVGLRIPLEAGKGYHLDLEPSGPRLRTACVLNESFVAATPMGEILRLAGTVEFSGINRCLVRRRLEMLRQGAAAYLRSVGDAPGHSEWCGLRPCTPDGLPVIGWAPQLGGLFVATGHAKMGLTHGPITGRLASECILDGRPSLDITPLRTDRF
jgi:D-amino-acid dehydrogenase